MIKLTPIPPNGFLPTELGFLDYVLTLSLLGVTAITLTCFMKYFSKAAKQGKMKADTANWAGSILVVICSVVAVGVIFMTAPTNAQTDANRLANIQKIYDVDAIAPFGGVSMVETVVTKDNKAYKVFYSEDKKTFEPTLMPFQNSFDISELERVKK